MIYGHIHNHADSEAFRYLERQERALNAGADIVQFAPATFEELVMHNRAFKEAYGRKAAWQSPVT